MRSTIGTAQRILLAVTYKRKRDNRINYAQCSTKIDKDKWEEEERKIVKYSEVCVKYRNKLDESIATAKSIYEITSYLRIKQYNTM